MKELTTSQTRIARMEITTMFASAENTRSPVSEKIQARHRSPRPGESSTNADEIDEGAQRVIERERIAVEPRLQAREPAAQVFADGQARACTARRIAFSNSAASATITTVRIVPWTM